MRHLVGAGKQVHHPAEQDRIEKLQTGNHQVGEREKPRNADVPAKEAENTAIDFEKSHLASLGDPNVSACHHAIMRGLCGTKGAIP
jgi:hypothetical protein